MSECNPVVFIEDFDENNSVTDLSENGLKQKQKST